MKNINDTLTYLRTNIKERNNLIKATSILLVENIDADVKKNKYNASDK